MPRKKGTPDRVGSTYKVRETFLDYKQKKRSKKKYGNEADT